MEKGKEIKKVIAETYAGNIAGVIESDKEGLVKKIIHGEELHEIEKRNLSPQSRKNRVFMLVGVLLLTAALATLYFLLLKRDVSNVPATRQFTPIIFSDQSNFLEILGLNKEKIIQTVSNDINTTTLKEEGVRGIYLTENKQIIGLRRFIAVIKGNFVPDKNPLLVSDNFLMGVANTQSRDFFMLLQMRFIGDIFDSMRAWEPELLTDLHGFLGIEIKSETNYLFKKSFEDGIIENKNARILYDREGKIVVMYIFADNNFLLITSTPRAAHEIILRLNSSQTKQ